MPDHDTLASFRRRFLDELAGLFVQVLEMAREMKLLKLGTISLDGTKIKANASRHSATAYHQHHIKNIFRGSGKQNPAFLVLTQCLPEKLRPPEGGLSL